jgi:transcription elongation factor GreA
VKQHYTQKALDSLDEQIVNAEARLSEAMLSMGSGAGADNNTWHDNPAFDQAKADVDQARNLLNRLRSFRDGALLVETANSDVVDVGSTVVIKFTNGDEPKKVYIAGHHVFQKSSEDKGTIEVSTSAPLGAALLHHKVGDIVAYDAPNHKRIEVSILELV